MLLDAASLADVLELIVNTLTGGLVNMGEGIANGAKSFITALIYQGEAASRTVSDFVGIIAVFGGIALAVGFTTLIFNWVTNLGA